MNNSGAIYSNVPHYYVNPLEVHKENTVLKPKSAILMFCILLTSPIKIFSITKIFIIKY